MIDKGVLHLYQSEFVEMRKEREKIEKKEKERKAKKKKKEEVRFSTGFPAFERREFDDQEVNWTTLQEVGVLSYSG